MLAVEIAGRGRDIGGLGGELAANCRNVSEPAFASALIETELERQLGDCQQCELLGCGLFGLTLRHSGIIAKGCDTVAW
jgi:hypothetical protein